MVSVPEAERVVCRLLAVVEELESEEVPELEAEQELVGAPVRVVELAQAEPLLSQGKIRRSSHRRL